MDKTSDEPASLLGFNLRGKQRQRVHEAAEIFLLAPSSKNAGD
jgi:hypothetical protein